MLYWNSHLQREAIRLTLKAGAHNECIIKVHVMLHVTTRCICTVGKNQQGANHNPQSQSWPRLYQSQMTMEMMTMMIRISSQHDGGCVSYCPVLAAKQNICSFLVTAKHIYNITPQAFLPIMYIYNSNFLSTQNLSGTICFFVQGESLLGVPLTCQILYVKQVGQYKWANYLILF